MGASTSKPETKVFTPAAPVDFSASFLSQLENSPESNYSRAQYTEKYIQERVAKELNKLEKDALKQLQQQTDDALSRTDEPSLSVLATDEKLSKLTEKIQKNVGDSEIHVSREVTKARESVIKCLTSNQGKPLNCWEEVEQFKKLVKDI